VTSTNSNPLPGQAGETPKQEVSFELKAAGVLISGGTGDSGNSVVSIMLVGRLPDKGRYTGTQLTVSAFGGKLKLTYSPAAAAPFLGFTILNEPPCVLLGQSTKELVAGVEQTLELVVRSGTLPLKQVII
jgi:hypothetical protein